MRNRHAVRLDPNDAYGTAPTLHVLGSVSEQRAFLRGVKEASGWPESEVRAYDKPGEASPFRALFSANSKLEARPPKLFRFGEAADRDAFVQGVQAASGWLDPRAEVIEAPLKAPRLRLR